MIVPKETLLSIFEDEPSVVTAIENFPEKLDATLHDVDFDLQWELLDLSSHGLEKERPGVIIWIKEELPGRLGDFVQRVLKLREGNRELLGGITLDVRLDNGVSDDGE